MAYQTVNPATNQLIKEYPSHTDADVEAALKAADALYHSDWAKATLTSACRYCVNLRTHRRTYGGSGQNCQQGDGEAH